MVRKLEGTKFIIKKKKKKKKLCLYITHLNIISWCTGQIIPSSGFLFFWSSGTQYSICGHMIFIYLVIWFGYNVPVSVWNLFVLSLPGSSCGCWAERAWSLRTHTGSKSHWSQLPRSDHSRNTHPVSIHWGKLQLSG